MYMHFSLKNTILKVFYMEHNFNYINTYMHILQRDFIDYQLRKYVNNYNILIIVYLQR